MSGSILCLQYQTTTQHLLPILLDPVEHFLSFEMFGLYRALAEQLLPSASPGIQGGCEGMLFRPDVGNLVFILLYWHQVV